MPRVQAAHTNATETRTTGGSGFLLLQFVLLDTGKETLTALGLVHVLDANVDVLVDNTVTHNLVHTDTDSALGDVVHTTSATVVELVWHTLVDSTVGLDIHVVTDLERTQVRRKLDHTALTEWSGKHITRTRTVTERVRHC